MFDAKDGREVWRVTRTDVPTWGTPTIHQVNGQTQILCTPLVYRGLVYITRYNGVLVVFDAKTGDKEYEQRLAGATNAFTASPVATTAKSTQRARTARPSCWRPERSTRSWR